MTCVDGLAVPDAGHESRELIPEMLLRQLPDRDGPAPEVSAPFNQTLMMLIRLLVDIQRDHLVVVREKMEQLRRLNREMRELRAQSPRPDPAADDGAGPGSAPAAEMIPRPLPEVLTHDRPDPQAVQAMVGHRLAAWEKERQSRWRKVMDLLVKL